MRTCAIIHPLHLELETALLIACPDEQMVGPRPILSDAGLRIEREMSGGVCDWLELVCQREGLCIDE